MGALSDYAETRVLNHLFRGVDYTPPASWYAAAFKIMPTDAGAGGVEVQGNAYVRVPVNTGRGNTTGWSDPGVGNITDNLGLIQWPTSTPGDWGQVVGVGLYDAVAGGNLIVYGILTVAQSITAGQRFEIAVGEFDIILE